MASAKVKRIPPEASMNSRLWPAKPSLASGGSVSSAIASM